LEIGDQAAFGVDDGGVQNYFLNLFSKNEYARVVGGFRLIGALAGIWSRRVGRFRH